MNTAASIRRAIEAAAWEGFVDHDPGGDEGRVRSIWAEVLQIAPAHPEEDFRSLGGGSLEIVQLLARIHEEFGLEIPVDPLLDDTFTVSSVVALIKAARAGGADSDEGAIPWVET